MRLTHRALGVNLHVALGNGISWCNLTATKICRKPGQKLSNKCKTTWDIIKELPSKADVQELMISCKHLKHQQGDAFNNYFSSIIDKISNNVDKKSNYENLSTFHYYVEQNYIHPSSSLVFKTFSTKEITSIL